MDLKKKKKARVSQPFLENPALLLHTTCPFEEPVHQQVEDLSLIVFSPIALVLILSDCHVRQQLSLDNPTWDTSFTTAELLHMRAWPPCLRLA